MQATHPTITENTKPATRKAAAPPPEKPTTAPVLPDVEVEMISSFVHLAHLVGLPRSYGEIYGLLFSHSKPLPLEGIISRLGISAGSASQGVRVLRSMRLINVVYQTGDRRDHFTAETRLQNLIAGVLRERLSPHLQSGTEQVTMLGELVDSMEDSTDRDHYEQRVQLMRRWVRHARRLIPVLMRGVTRAADEDPIL